MIIIFGSSGEIADWLNARGAQESRIVRPQTSGPCVHYDPDGVYYSPPGGEHQDEPPVCAYPYPCDEGCPHLDDPAILCPVKDACYAMREIAHLREACEAEQEEQVSSLCGYYDERSEHVDNIDPCTHPDACKTGCPYLDDDGIYCPQKDEWSAASKQAEEDLAWAWGDDIPKFVPLAQDPEGRGTDMVAEAPDTIPRSDYVLAPQEPPAAADEPDVAPGDDPAPVPAEGRRTPRGRCWTPEEDTVLRTAASAVSAQVAYRESFPDSGRTPAAVSSRWYKVRSPAPTPTPDFAGDTVPVTQYDEPRSTGAPPYPLTGARVQIRSLPEFAGQIGTVVQYDPDSPEMLVALDNSLDRIWLPPESLVLVGAGRGSP